MNILRHLLIVSALAASVPLSAQDKDVLMSKYIFTFPMRGDHGRTYGNLTYAHDVDQHPGPAGLSESFPRKYSIERDEKGVIRKVTSRPHQMTVRPSKEEWTAGDPNAFSVDFGYSPDGPIIRTSTVGRIQVNGVPVMVMRSIFHGFREGDNQIADAQPGETKRAEHISPEPGLGIATIGHEVDGKFLPKERHTLTKFRNNNQLRLQRAIEERFSAETNQWEKVSDQLKEWRRIDGQWEQTRIVHDPDGNSVTEEWEYYRNGERSGPDGHINNGVRLKRHLQKDGTEVRHQYLRDGGGTIMETRYPNGSVRLFSEIAEEVSKDTKVRTAIETLDGVEVSKVVKEFGPTRHVYTTSTPGRPDRVEIREYYPNGHDFAGSERRIIYPDGTMKTMERTRLEDGIQHLIEEIGTHDGERVIEGERTTIIFGNRPDSGKTTERINRR